MTRIYFLLLLLPFGRTLAQISKGVAGDEAGYKKRITPNQNGTIDERRN